MEYDLVKPIIKNIYRYKKNRNGTIVISRKKIGVLVAGILPGTEFVTFGFSLCHPNDEFNWVPRGRSGSVKETHYGRDIAAKRAIRWAKASQKQFIPYKIRCEAFKFIQRCLLYYKDKHLMHLVIESTTR